MKRLLFDIYFKLLEVRDELIERGEDDVVEKLNHVISKIERVIKHS